MSAITELPAELPPLPPVPAGYDCWELCGWGGLCGPQGHPWAVGDSLSWESGKALQHPLGHGHLFYIRAKRDSPAPAQGDALSEQVGGDHYKQYAIQPVEFITKNKLGFCEGNAIKYLCRHGSKNGVQDLRKAIHYIELLIQMEYPEE